MKLIKTILVFLFNQLKLITPLFLQSSNLKKIFNYYKVPDLFETSGQPNNKQLISIANDGYEAVKYALDQVIGSMEKLNSGLDTEEKEHHFERALSSIYFLQKCLDFEKGGDLAKNLFKVYEFCRVQIVEFALKGTVKKLDTAIEFVQTILEGWEGVRP